MTLCLPLLNCGNYNAHGTTDLIPVYSVDRSINSFHICLLIGNMNMRLAGKSTIIQKARNIVHYIMTQYCNYMGFYKTILKRHINLGLV